MINGVSVYGITRAQLEGGVLSIYNMFDDDQQIVITAYVLNDAPSRRKFNDLGEYRVARDEFLSVYASCLRSVHKN